MCVRSKKTRSCLTASIQATRTGCGAKKKKKNTHLLSHTQTLLCDSAHHLVLLSTDRQPNSSPAPRPPSSSHPQSTVLAVCGSSVDILVETWLCSPERSHQMCESITLAVENGSELREHLCLPVTYGRQSTPNKIKSGTSAEANWQQCSST